MNDTVQFSPSVLRGSVRIPASKSMAHRLLICAALAPGESIVRRVDDNQDITATIAVLRGIGAQIDPPAPRGNGASLHVTGLQPNVLPQEPVTVHCGESGSTLRFLLPVAAALGLTVTFTGGGLLPKRPIRELTDVLAAHGVQVTFHGNDSLPLTISGRLQSGAYTLPGNVSSQYISGLLFALPLLDQPSTLTVTGKLESIGYIDLTAAALLEAGVCMTRSAGNFSIPAPQRYCPIDTAVEGDWSQAAFFLAAGALGGDVTLTGLNPKSLQGDRACETLLRQFGANLHWENEALHCSGGVLHGGAVDASQIPDLVPVLSVVSCFCSGGVTIHGAARLRLKESDRLESTCQLLNTLGGNAAVTADGLIIQPATLAGGYVNSCNDHRILMSAAIAALRAQMPVTATEPYCVDKSYPRFYHDYTMLGGNAHVFDSGNSVPHLRVW